MPARGVAVHVAVLRIALGAAQPGLRGADAFEHVQRLAHQFADGAVLFGHGLLQADRIDVQRHASHTAVGAEAQRGDHQSHAQVVRGAHRGALVLVDRHPTVPVGVIPAFRHHRGAGGRERDGHVALRKVRADLRVEPVRQAQPAQQQRHGLPVHPFRSVGVRRLGPLSGFVGGLRGVGMLRADLDGEGASLLHQSHDRGDAVVVQRVDVDVVAVGVVQGDEGRILEQRHIDLRGLGPGDRVLRGLQAQAGVALQPGAHRGEPVEVAFDLQGFEHRAERHRGVPCEEVAAGIGGGVQVQRFGAVHGLQPRRGVQHAGLAHQVGEVVLQPGGAQPVRAGLHRVAQGTADRPHRRLAVEPAEDVARAESQQQPLHLRQHVRGEERDGDRVPVFQVAAHGLGQVRAHLFERVPVAGFQPCGQPHHPPARVAAHHAAADRPASPVPFMTRNGRQRHLLLPAEHEPGLHAVGVHPRIVAHEHAPLRVGERDLAEPVTPHEHAERKRPGPVAGQLRPAQAQRLRHAVEAVEQPALDQRRERHRLPLQLPQHVLGRADRLVEGVALRRTMRAVPRYGAGQGTEHLKDRAHAMTRPRKAVRSGVE